MTTIPDNDRVDAPPGRLRYPWLIVLAAALILPALAWMHTAMDVRYGEDEPDWSFYGYIIGGWICKTVVLASAPILLMSLYRVTSSRPSLWRRWAVLWIGSMFLLIVSLAYFRDSLANCFNSSSFRMFPVADDIPAARHHFIGRENWLPRWNRGEILLIELAYVLVIAGIIRACGRWISKPTASAIIATFTCVAATIAWPNIFSMVNLDYDIFFGGIISDSIYIDALVMFLAAPFAPIDLTTQIASLVYLAFTISTLSVIIPRANSASPDV